MAGGTARCPWVTASHRQLPGQHRRVAHQRPDRQQGRVLQGVAQAATRAGAHLGQQANAETNPMSQGYWTRGALLRVTAKPFPGTGYQACWRERQHSTAPLLLPLFHRCFSRPFPSMRALLPEQEPQGRGRKGLATSTAAVGSPCPTTAHSYNRTNPPESHILRL